MGTTTPTTPPTRAAGWAVVGMLWVVCFLNYADRQAIFAVFPMLEQEFGFNDVELGLIGSAFMWVYAGGALFAGAVGDRVRRKDLILGGCLFWSAVTVVTGQCSRLWHFVTVRALEGFGETFYFPASVSLLSDYHGTRSRSRALAVHQSAVYAGTIAGGWFGAWLAVEYGWRVGFYAFGGAGLLTAAVLYFLLREPVRGGSEGTPTTKPLPFRETVRAIVRSPAAPVLMLGFLSANAVAAVFLTWAPMFLVKKFHFELAAAGLSGSVFIHLASVPGVLVGGWLADRLTVRYRGGRAATQAVGLAVGAGFVVLIGLTTRVNVLLAAMTALGFCKGMYDANIFATLYDIVPPPARATAAGLMNTIGWGGGAVGPVAIGLVAEYGPYETKIENMSVAIAAGGIVYVFGAILLATAAVLISRSPRSIPS